MRDQVEWCNMNVQECVRARLRVCELTSSWLARIEIERAVKGRGEFEVLIDRCMRCRNEIQCNACTLVLVPLTS